jgi:phage terminase small subunit
MVELIQVIDAQQEAAVEFEQMQAEIRAIVETKEKEHEKKDSQANAMKGVEETLPMPLVSVNELEEKKDGKDGSKPESRITSETQNKKPMEVLDAAAEFKKSVSSVAVDHIKREKYHPSKQLAQILVEGYQVSKFRMGFR